MEPIILTNLRQLMDISEGIPAIRIGLIDGPILENHPGLNNVGIEHLPSISGKYLKQDGEACLHGTFVAGILKAKRGMNALGICPNCTLLVRPVFFDSHVGDTSLPFTTPEELAIAIIDCIHAGARIINLSLAISFPSSKIEKELEEALSYASNRGVIIVAAAGNQGVIGSTSITRHPWVIPVIAADHIGLPMQLSNLCSSIGRNGVSAPGESIESLGLDDNLQRFSGTSAAAPFVTGVIALLWSIFPNLSAGGIKQAVSVFNNKKNMIPPLLNAAASFQYLNTRYSQKSVA